MSEIDELKAAIGELTEAMKSFSMGMQGGAVDLEAMAKAAGKSAAELEKEAKDRAEKLRRDREYKEEEARIKYNQKVATDKSVTALDEFTEALFSGKQGFEKYNKTLDAAGAAMVALTKNMGGLAQVVGLVINATMKLGQAQLKQADNVLKASDELSKMGGVGGLTSNQLLEMAHNAGLTSKNLELMYKPIKSMGSSILTLGDNAAAGQKAFMELTAVSKTTRMEFQKLGISQEDLIQNQADYIKLQGMAGISLKNDMKDRARLQKASTDYTENLLILAQISGTDVDTIKKKQEEAMRSLDFQLYILEEQSKAAELRKKAETTNDETLKAKYIAQADSIEKTIKSQSDLVKQLNNQYPQLASAFREITSQKTITGKATQQVLMMMPEMETAFKRANERLKRGDNAGEVRAELEEQFKLAAIKGGRDYRIALGSNPELAQDLGYSVDLVNTLNKTLDRNEKEEQEKARKRIEDQKKTGDVAQNARATLLETERSAAVALDKLVAATNPLMSGFNKTTISVMILQGAALAAAAALTAIAGKKFLAGLATKPTATQAAAQAASTTAAGRVGAGLIKGAGVAAVGGLVGSGLDMAGQAVGGTTGKVLSGAGTVAQGAAIGAMLGPVGAIVGGLGGLALAIYQNIDQEKSQQQEQKESNANSINVTKKLNEETEALGKILGGNSDQIKNFAGKLGTMSDTDFKNFVDQLKINAEASGKQTGEIEKQTKALEKARENAKKKELEEEKKQLQRKEIDPSKKFTTEDAKTLEDNEKEVELLQASLAEAKTREEKAAIKDAIKTLENQGKLLRDKKAEYDKFHELETDRLLAEQKKLDNQKKINDVLVKAKQQRLEREKNLERQVAAKQTVSPGDSEQGLAGQQVAASAATPVGATQAKAAAVTTPSPTGPAQAATPAGPSVASTASEETVADATTEAKRTTTKPKNVILGQNADMTGVSSNLLTSFYAAAAEYGKDISVNSAYRGDEKQAELWVRGNILKEAGIFTPAKPKNDTTINYRGQTYRVPGSGRGSSHGSGQALDVSANWDAFDPILTKYGMHRPYAAKDPPHVELKAEGGGIFSGPDTGYPVMQHGTEITAPLDTESILMKMAKTAANSEEAAKLLSFEKTPNENNNKTADVVREMLSANTEIFNMLVGKLDRVIDVLSDGNDTSNKLLQQSRI